MIYLLLSIAASSLIFVIFKGFERYKITILYAIIVNYIVAASCGVIAYEGAIIPYDIVHYDWFLGAILLGVVFIIVFNLMAITTQRSGLSTVAVATKMSVAIPILFGIYYYNEAISGVKAMGIICALVAVYLASVRTKSHTTSKAILFPILVFVGSGIIDTSLKFLEHSYVQEEEVPLFSATIFASAGCIGLIIILFQALKGSFRFQAKNIVAGIVLGVPNYFSIYFLVKALQYHGFDSSTIFTLNNVAIVTVSTFLGILLFKERLLIKNWIGIALAVISIILVSLS